MARVPIALRRRVPAAAFRADGHRRHVDRTPIHGLGGGPSDRRAAAMVIPVGTPDDGYSVAAVAATGLTGWCGASGAGVCARPPHRWRDPAVARATARAGVAALDHDRGSYRGVVPESRDGASRPRIVAKGRDLGSRVPGGGKGRLPAQERVRPIDARTVQRRARLSGRSRTSPSSLGRRTNPYGFWLSEVEAWRSAKFMPWRPLRIDGRRSRWLKRSTLAAVNVGRGQRRPRSTSALVQDYDLRLGAARSIDDRYARRLRARRRY